MGRLCARNLGTPQGLRHDGLMSSTPRLVVDVDVMQANLERTAALAVRRGFALRPHVKTHKTPEIARLQLTAGARGITVATIGEAEVFADAGCDDILIAYPLWIDESATARLRRLTETVRLSIGCDSLESVAALPRGVAELLIEVDCGHHRSGVAPSDAGDLAARLVAAGQLVRGAFTFPGHSYAPGAAAAVAADEAEALVQAGHVMAAAGVPATELSGGSTPSLAFADPGLTEYRPGVYVFNDAQQWELGTCTPEQIALTCHARVVSRHEDRVALDSGSKVLGADRAPYATGGGRLLDDPDARIVQLSEHHAVVTAPVLPALGSTVRVVPNHVCNAVNLADELQLVGADGRPAGVWAVAARGRNL